MERRQSPRQSVDEVVILTNLSSIPSGPPAAANPARVVERSAFGLRIESPVCLAPSTLVRLDSEDSLLLGEVAWCAAVNGRYQMGLKIEQSLQHVGDLSRLMASLLGGETQRPLTQAQAVEACCD